MVSTEQSHFPVAFYPASRIERASDHPIGWGLPRACLIRRVCELIYHSQSRLLSSSKDCLISATCCSISARIMPLTVFDPYCSLLIGSSLMSKDRGPANARMDRGPEWLGAQKMWLNGDHWAAHIARQCNQYNPPVPDVGDGLAGSDCRCR